VRVVNKIIIR